MVSLLLIRIITTNLIFNYAAESTTPGMGENAELSSSSSSSTVYDESFDTETSPTTQTSTTTHSTRKLEYYFSAESYTWEDAQIYCKTLGETGRLAEFRSVEELRSAVNYIMLNTSGGNFWIGGIFKSRKWQWANGGRVDESISRWPSSRQAFTRNSRLSITLRSRFHVNWMSHPKTESIRLLCQF